MMIFHALPSGPIRKGLASTLLLLLSAAALLTGCGEQSNSGTALNEPVQKYEKDATLAGTVTGQNGAITNGKILATDEKGNVISISTLENTSRYSIVIPAGTLLPILLQVHPDAGSENGKPLTLAIADASMTNYNINPLTTAIAEKAKSLGGYTRKNLMAAAVLSTSVPDEDKTSSGFRGDPTKNYGGWH
ncbi:hypothetical protein [Methylococcus sp. Mc7]|jgi:hypothetical protein|uniref:hypothetical protein n=1 Tax=Methylococcus sp. Mc7 TaxID=2860258 RepID=UPI001C527ADE|nr:hypothetical protein [Methylococcus sp. Mc7]QXP85125.1 hypothetical protein KW115_05155 [Methylococcus sp. Mc7]